MDVTALCNEIMADCNDTQIVLQSWFLITETHIALLKVILREEDTSNADLKDSVNSTLYFIDGMTWPEVLRVYCESDREYHHVLPYQEVDEYPYGPLESKIKVLQFLVDQFLTTNIARDELMSNYYFVSSSIAF
ncbi:hypothetical protein KUCAC02_010375 [Chaenocephalus aceratus]|uniref:Uncharacterized protein n=1 Tax=Chaenocephalus aceratus TaxID=36190 RepID=A0ACB9VZQ0_CHAAC|nr:hypothetical protein KUCAC02_010375 [Chaenocephalus aceratus]